MQQALTELNFATSGRGMTDISAEIAAWLRSSGAETGLLTLFIRHTSASLTIQEKATARSRRRTAGGGKNGNKSVSGGDEQASTGGPTAEGDDVDLDGTLF